MYSYTPIYNNLEILQNCFPHGICRIFPQKKHPLDTVLCEQSSNSSNIYAEFKSSQGALGSPSLRYLIHEN